MSRALPHPSWGSVVPTLGLTAESRGVVRGTETEWQLRGPFGLIATLWKDDPKRLSSPYNFQPSPTPKPQRGITTTPWAIRQDVPLGVVAVPPLDYEEETSLFISAAFA